MDQQNITKNLEQIPQGLHIVAKPVGPTCNLNCDYCFYIEKLALFGEGESYRMNDTVLSTFITKYIASQPAPVVEFVWQGGEPTLFGIDFFKRVIELQKPFSIQKRIINSLQTNGTMLTDQWCDFLKKHNFLVGISIDGSQEIHDNYRKDHLGIGSFGKVIRGLRLLQKHGVEYNVMACVARNTAKKPLEVYNFLKDEGVKFIQFFPIIERMPDASAAQYRFRFAGPASLNQIEHNTEVTPWTVIPEEYGDFLNTIFDEWVRNDVGKIFIMNFEWALNAWLGKPSSVCTNSKQCGRSLVIEHNGDIYACDHCVYPQYKLGNILFDDLMSMVGKSLQSGFGIAKETTLPRWCRECEFLFACYGGCPKHRFIETIYGEPGLHYLCIGYKNFYHHISKYMKAFMHLINNGLPFDYIMQVIERPTIFTSKVNGQQLMLWVK